MTDAQPILEHADPHPEAAAHPAAAPSILALLVTRCQCQRALKVPNNPPPKTVTVDLVPLKGQLAPEKRVFYKAGETATPEGEKVLVYQEGPPLEGPRILLPGMIPPKDIRTRRPS